MFSKFSWSLEYTNTLVMFEIVYLSKGLLWADKQQEGHLWSIYIIMFSRIQKSLNMASKQS